MKKGRTGNNGELLEAKLAMQAQLNHLKQTLYRFVT